MNRDQKVVRRQQETLAAGEKFFDQEPGLKRCVSPARVMHEAVKIWRQKGEKRTLYIIGLHSTWSESGSSLFWRSNQPW